MEIHSQPSRADQVQVVMREFLGARQLVIVSNREPYAHRRTDQGVDVENPAGGLVAALDPVMQAARGVWVAWGSGDADFEVTDARDCIAVPPGDAAYTLRRVRLTRDEVERFYHGYSNQALWPLFHLAVDKARFVRRHWTAYQEVNRRFAEATCEMISNDAAVWVQDYHLALCPGLIRMRMPDVFLMQFWHIPWPSWDVYRICPQSAELLEGLLANDLIAFHLPRFVENFLDCAQQELGADVDHDEGIVEYAGRRTKVQAFPISIDVDAWERLATSKACERWMARLGHRLRLGHRSLGVGVDRLDYTKGIPERLRAIELLLQRHPGMRERVVFVQKSAPSRTRIKAYRDLQDRVEAGIERINAAFGTEAWQPIVHLPRPIAPAGMAALYRMADFCLVSSLQDGMNLVAKEFVASQVDGRGVLVLSELAGAADEAPWAITINPYDPDSTVEALVRALQMPAPEREERMRQMRGHLRQRDIYHWMEQHFRAAAHLLAGRAATRSVFDEPDAIRALVRMRSRLAVLLDLDGMLASLADRPAGDTLSSLTRALLARLARRPWCDVAVISARGLVDLRERVGLRDVVYVGNHGFEMAGPGWAAERRDASDVRELIAACSRRLRERLRGIRGAVVDDRGLTARIHYQQVRREQLDAVLQPILEEITQIPPGKVELRRGKRMVELRPVIEWDKGRAAVWVLEQLAGKDWRDQCAVIYAGDGRADEEAFLALGDEAVTIRLGADPAPTAARYNAGGVSDLTRFLQEVLVWDAQGARVGARSGR